MTNIVNFTPPPADFSRKIESLMSRIRDGGLFWWIILQDQDHQDRGIPPTLSFGTALSMIPTADAVEAATELRDIWWKDDAFRQKLFDWEAERGLILHKMPTPQPSTSRGNGAA